jgi:hypothetical protein
MDYTEELRKDFHAGSVSGFLTLKIPTGKFKVTEWVTANRSSEFFVDSEGFEDKIPPFIRIFAAWLSNLHLLSGFKNGVASIILQKPKETQICLWDVSQRFASFAVLKEANLRTNPNKYLQSLWTSPSDLSSSFSEPKVIVERRQSGPKRASVSDTPSRKSDQSTMVKEVAQLSKRLSAIPVKEIEDRVKILEADTGYVDAQASAILIKRLDETAALLEGLSKRLQDLEKRLDRIGIREEK